MIYFHTPYPAGAEDGERLDYSEIRDVNKSCALSHEQFVA